MYVNTDLKPSLTVQTKNRTYKISLRNQKIKLDTSMDLMTTSLPSMPVNGHSETSTTSSGSSEKSTGNTSSIRSELDKIGDRLGKFMSNSTKPKPAVNSHSRLPKPEVGPKPAHLAAQLAAGRHQLVQTKVPGTGNSSIIGDNPRNNSQKSSGDKNATASMLKSTLKRMSKLTQIKGVKSGNSPPGNSATVGRTKSFKEPEPPGIRVVKRGGQVEGTGVQRSQSLRRVKNKDLVNPGPGYSGNHFMVRSGTSGTLDRNMGVKRTHSITGTRRFRDRDLNVKLSRGVQTQLTKDTVDEPEFTDDGGNPTTLEFTVYLAELLGGDNDQVETHVTDPTEPVDVRKNRQLTLDNMKLHRELEKLKQAANEHDSLKKELRSVKAKLEEEQKSRARIEHQLDAHNNKVKEIAASMDSVEREFEDRDKTIAELEQNLGNARSRLSQAEADLTSAREVIRSQRSDLEAALDAQKALVQQCQHTENESAELQEFLQTEKLALAETLKDSEAELERMTLAMEAKDNEVGHLVRLGEQRHQEILTAQAKFSCLQEKAKQTLLTQGADLAQAIGHLADLSTRLEMRIDPSKQKSDLQFNSQRMIDSIREQVLDSINNLHNDDINNKTHNGQSGENNDSSLHNLSVAITNRQLSEDNSSCNSPPQNGGDSSAGQQQPTLVEHIARVEQLIDVVMLTGNETNRLNNGDHVSTVTPSNSFADEKVVSNGTSEESVEQLKAKFLKHRQIYVSNYEQAEVEIKRLDRICQTTIDQVLQTLRLLPQVVSVEPQLQKLQANMETALKEGMENLSTQNTDIAKMILEEDPNQSL